ncbi:MAG: hypothetical protein M3Y21_02575 [Candidatus Eremiobacteraeota bacterium]|nr:hypothetical protein [Candidatus Eremiobacteraeota bacterium]
MSRERTVAVTLKIPDNEAFTALSALVRLEVPVAKVERAVIWSFDNTIEDGFLDRVKCNELLYNPNKHLLREIENRPQPGEVWIEQLGEHDDMRNYLGSRSIPGISSGRRCIAWRLTNQAGEPVEASVLTDAIAKLLCNPAIERAITA